MSAEHVFQHFASVFVALQEPCQSITTSFFVRLRKMRTSQLHSLQSVRQANLLRFVNYIPPTKPSKAREEFRLANRPLVGNLAHQRFYTAPGPLLTVATLEFDTSKRVLARWPREKQDRRAYSVPRSDVLSSLETSFSLFTPSICSMTSTAACGTRCCQGSLRSILFRISEPE